MFTRPGFDRDDSLVVESIALSGPGRVNNDLGTRRGFFMSFSVERNRFYPTLKDRPGTFWAKVQCGEAAECWPWTGCLSTSGYGRAGKRGYAHRLAFELTHGVTLRPGDFICHQCDNPPCCNPSHLFLGDAGINARDMASKGRVGGGGPAVNALLIQELATSGLSIRAIHRATGHSRKSVRKVLGSP